MQKLRARYQRISYLQGRIRRYQGKKNKSQNGGYKKKEKTPNFPENEHFLRTCAYQ